LSFVATNALWHTVFAAALVVGVMLVRFRSAHRALIAHRILVALYAFFHFIAPFY